MNNSKIGIGIIGLGGFGQFLIKQWGQMEDVQVVASNDQNPAHRHQLSENIKFYADDNDLLADPDVQIVSIATPPYTHADIALKAIAAGKHVLVEKPLALSAGDACLIEKAAAKAGVIATVNFMLRYDPLVESLKQIVTNEVFGKIRRVDLRNYATQDTVPEGHWFWKPEMSGGILIEHGVHFFDMASWLIGSRAIEVTGLTVERKPGMEDRVFAAVEYETGVVGTFWHSFSRPMELETTSFHMAFDLGEIEVCGWVPLSASFWGWTDETGQEKLAQLLPDPAAEIEGFPVKDVRSSEFTYRVSRNVKGNFVLPKPKLDVYGDCLRSILQDMVFAIRNPKHQLRVTASDGIQAVAVAEQATAAARALGKHQD